MQHARCLILRQSTRSLSPYLSLRFWHPSPAVRVPSEVKLVDLFPECHDEYWTKPEDGEVERPKPTLENDSTDEAQPVTKSGTQHHVRKLFVDSKSARDLIREKAELIQRAAQKRSPVPPSDLKQHQHERDSRPSPERTVVDQAQLRGPPGENRAIAEAKSPLSSSGGQLNLDLDLLPAPGHPVTRFSRRGVVLTGGTSGIGFEIACRLIRLGVGRILLITRSLERGEEAISRISSLTSTPRSLLPISLLTADLKHLHTQREVLQAIHSFTACNTLINCAAMPQHKTLLHTSNEAIEEILNVNLRSPILLAKTFLNMYTKHLSQPLQPSPSTSPRPSWVHISLSSLLATRGITGSSVYATTKAALLGLSTSLIAESTTFHRRYSARFPSQTYPTLRSNVVVPGYIDTPMVTDTQKQSLINDGTLNRIPAGRMGSASEVAEAVLFCVGNEYMNGGVVGIDGGLGSV